MAVNIDVIMMNNDRQVLAKCVASEKTDTSITATVVEVTPLGSKIHVGAVIMVKYLDSVNGINMFSGVVSSIKGTVVKIDDLKIITKIQRRKNVKVRARYDAQIFRQLDKATYSYSVRVVDISAGGVGFNSRENLPMNDTYYYLFDRNGKKISIKMKILRQKPIEGGFFYGCQFMEMLPSEEENVRQFVFRTQLLQKKLEQTKTVD